MKPPFRKLRGYAFDPSVSLDIDSFEVNDITYQVRWEDKNDKDQDGDALFGPGPVGEYVEVIDYDPSTGTAYEPIDLDDPYVLATDGLAPSESLSLIHI